MQANKKEGGKAHENDISAKEEAAQKGARLQKKNEDKEWQKCTEEKKKKRKKSFISIETANQSGLFVIDITERQCEKRKY